MKNLNSIPREINLRQAILLGKDISNANLCDADLQNTNLIGYDFINKDLTSINLRAASITGCDFTGAILRNGNLSGVKTDKIRTLQNKEAIVLLIAIP